jgi:hypothetical protein
MDANPYAASTLPAKSIRQQEPRNFLGMFGFYLSLTALTGGMSVGSFGQIVSVIGMCVAFLALPAFFLSLVALCWPPRRLAAWGVGLGLFQSLYLQTFYLSLFVLGRS